MYVLPQWKPPTVALEWGEVTWLGPFCPRKANKKAHDISHFDDILGYRQSPPPVITEIFTAAFLVPSRKTRSRCPSTREWTDKGISTQWHLNSTWKWASHSHYNRDDPKTWYCTEREHIDKESWVFLYLLPTTYPDHDLSFFALPCVHKCLICGLQHWCLFCSWGPAGFLQWEWQQDVTGQEEKIVGLFLPVLVAVAVITSTAPATRPVAQLSLDLVTGLLPCSIRPRG